MGQSVTRTDKPAARRRTYKLLGLVPILLTFALALPASASADGWVAQTSGTTSVLRGIAFSDATHGWAVGDNGTILATTNGGATWNPQSSGSYVDLHAVAFTDASHGWAVGYRQTSFGLTESYENTILATVNGGATWSTLVGWTYGGGLSAVAFTDASHGWVVGGDAQIWAATNSGATWSRQTFGELAWFSDVAFTDASHGWVVGGLYLSPTIGATTNGGATWSAQGLGAESSGTLTGLNGIAFADATHGWAVGATYDSEYNTTGNVIFATVNGGATWSPQSSGSTASLNDVAFTDATHGWAVGPDGTILATTNGGATWNPQSSGSSAWLYDVASTDANHGWAVGAGGTILATSTGGPTPTPTATVTLKLSGLRSGAMKLGRRVTAKGTVTPTRLAGSKVKLTVQKRGARWVTLKSVARTISASGAYSWKYKPARRGAYRMRATIAKTVAHTAATTKWRTFKVK